MVYLELTGSLRAYQIVTTTDLGGKAKGSRRDLSGRDSAWRWLIATMYGVSDEIHQSFIPRREASFTDLLADTLGALSFVVLLYFVRKR